MDIATFDDLLHAARHQDERQRLLLVFAGASLPAQASAAQHAEFEAGVGGELAPLMCVDKDPNELRDFTELAAEAETMGTPWQLVFAGALAGNELQAPAVAEVDAALERMVQAVRSGELMPYVAFDRSGRAVQLR